MSIPEVGLTFIKVQDEKQKEYYFINTNGVLNERFTFCQLQYLQLESG